MSPNWSNLERHIVDEMFAKVYNYFFLLLEQRAIEVGYVA